MTNFVTALTSSSDYQHLRICSLSPSRSVCKMMHFCIVQLTSISAAGRKFNCEALGTLVSTMFVVVIATSNFLLFLRLKAIDHDKVWVKRAYFLLWLVYVGCAAVASASKFITSVGDQCILPPSYQTTFAMPGALMALIFPTAVFGA